MRIIKYNNYFIKITLIFFLYVLLNNFIFAEDHINQWYRFYNAWYTTPPHPDLCLSDNEKPTMIYTDDIVNTYYEIESEYHTCIGDSTFNGINLTEREFFNDLEALAYYLKTPIVIYSKQYKTTETELYSVPHEDWNFFKDGDGKNRTFRNKSYETKTRQIIKYDYYAYFFINQSKLAPLFTKWGCKTENLTVEQRNKYKQNTGAIVKTVYKNTPAYYANLFRNDIIIRVNDFTIMDGFDLVDAKHFFDSNNITNIKMIVIRDGQEKELHLDIKEWNEKMNQLLEEW